jgi:hypothetical protein
MNRHLAHALGATALGALLLQPVTAMADPPEHARNEKSAQHRGYSSGGDRHDDRGWDDRDDDHRWDDHDRRDWYVAPHHRGHVVRHLPSRHRVVHYHGHRYYYGSGAWYRPYGSRYVVVDPPLGLVISFLPEFGTTVYVGGIPHYRAGPVYYVWNPRARGYVVTDRPYRRW